MSALLQRLFKIRKAPQSKEDTYAEEYAEECEERKKHNTYRDSDLDNLTKTYPVSSVIGDMQYMDFSYDNESIVDLLSTSPAHKLESEELAADLVSIAVDADGWRGLEFRYDNGFARALKVGWIRLGVTKDDEVYIAPTEKLIVFVASRFN